MKGGHRSGNGEAGKEAVKKETLLYNKEELYNSGVIRGELMQLKQGRYYNQGVALQSSNGVFPLN